MTEFDLLADGIAGHEVAWERVPKGCDVFQYALGKVEIDGEVAIFRRRSSERGTYGGWRWEGYASRLRPDPEPQSEPEPDQDFWFFRRSGFCDDLIEKIRGEEGIFDVEE